MSESGEGQAVGKMGASVVRNAPPLGIPRGQWHGYHEYIGPNGEMVLYQPSLEDLMREEQQGVGTPNPLPVNPSPGDTWHGYREYIGPNGEMILYQPSLGEILRGRGRRGKAPGPEQNAPGPGQNPPRDQAAAGDPPAPPVAEHPHTMERPGTAQPAPPPVPPQEGTAPPPEGDIDEEIRRHREWLRHRFDPPKPPVLHAPPPLDRTRPGSYQRLRDEADETSRRIVEIEEERRQSVLPDWFWDQLFGKELRHKLVHLRALRWQIEEFEKAYGAGNDPVAAVNKYNREQWEIFLHALMEHIQLLGQALMGIEAIRGFQKAVEEALEAANAARQKRAGEWLRTRERARQSARGGDEPPVNEGGGPPGAPEEHIGGLPRRDWRRIRMRRASDSFPQGSPENQEANRLYHEEFPADENLEGENGMTLGVVTLSDDGQTVSVVTWQMDPDGVMTGATAEVIPAGSMPEDLGLAPGQSAPFAYTNFGPR